jgi:hypothetical protein
MDGHSNGNNGRTMNGREDKMQFHIFSEYQSIHDEVYTFDSKYYEELRREAAKLGAKSRPSGNNFQGLRLVVDNTKKKQ